jgi:transcriptional regulator with XRE-family HTH domain
MTVGERLLAARTRLKKTQSEMGDLLDVTQTCICEWETGKALLKLADVRRVAKAYGLKPVDLIPGETESAARRARPS